MELIYEISVDGRRGVRLPASDVPAATPLPGELLRVEPAELPEISELDVVRHFTRLSRPTSPSTPRSTRWVPAP